jgi:hypothetical protein
MSTIAVEKVHSVVSAPSRLSRAFAVLAALAAAAVPLAVTPHSAAGPAVPAGSVDGGKVDSWSTGPADERRALARTALRSVEAIADGTASPAAKASSTIARRDLRVALRDLSATERARARVLLARPVTTQQLCSATTCVHYTTAGADAATPAFAQTVLSTVDSVRNRLVAGGYRAPNVDDPASPELDVYLEDSGARRLYGYCDSDDPKLGEPNPSGYDVSAYCGLDNDFRPSQFGGAAALDSLRVTVAHELFHAVQFAYDYLEDGWLMEATATWMEDELYDSVNDNRQYLRTSPLSAPARSLDRFGGLYHYGAWLFFRHLSERFPSATGGLPTIIRSIWTHADGRAGAADLMSIDAVTRALSDRRRTLTAEFARFAMANRSPRSFYSEGAAYPKAAASTVTIAAARRNPRATARVLDHLSSATVRYVPSRTTARNWKLKLAVNMAPRTRGSAAVVRVFNRNGSVRTINVSLNAKGDAVLSVPFSSRTVSVVEVTLVNASRRFSRCFAQPTPFSCSGLPVDDDLRQVVDPLAHRG